VRWCAVNASAIARPTAPPACDLEARGAQQQLVQALDGRLATTTGGGEGVEPLDRLGVEAASGDRERSVRHGGPATRAGADDANTLVHLLRCDQHEDHRRVGDHRAPGLACR
jgi:hypothetical protein